jgi:transposase-like protein
MIKPPVVEPISYAGYRFPPDVISYAVWLYFRFPLSLRMVEEMLAARSIDVTYETLALMDAKVWFESGQANPRSGQHLWRQVASR